MGTDGQIKLYHNLMKVFWPVVKKGIAVNVVLEPNTGKLRRVVVQHKAIPVQVPGQFQMQFIQLYIVFVEPIPTGSKPP